MAKVIQEFAGVVDGETVPRRFEAGARVFGDLARAAIAEGWAVEDPAAALAPPETAVPAKARPKAAAPKAVVKPAAKPRRAGGAKGKG